MLVFPSTDLQRNLGEILRAADSDPVLLTSHNVPRRVLMPVAEFVRLKAAAGEAIPSFGARRPVIHNPVPDPLGYDTSDVVACAEQMAEAALSGRNKILVRAEIDRVRRKLAATGKPA